MKPAKLQETDISAFDPGMMLARPDFDD